MICGKKGQRFPWLFVCLAIAAVEGRKHPSAGPMGPTSAGATDKSEKQRGRRQDHVQGSRGLDQGHQGFLDTVKSNQHQSS